MRNEYLAWFRALHSAATSRDQGRSVARSAFHSLLVFVFGG